MFRVISVSWKALGICTLKTPGSNFNQIRPDRDWTEIWFNISLDFVHLKGEWVVLNQNCQIFDHVSVKCLFDPFLVQFELAVFKV